MRPHRCWRSVPWLGAACSFLAAFAVGLVLADLPAEEEQRLPFCPPERPKNLDDRADNRDLRTSNSNVLFVSTLDGKLTALDPADGGKILWDVTTGEGDMISSTISRVEMTSSAQWVRLIPSLAGGLYRFDGETVEPLPLSAETLLRTSFKFTDNTIITGGKDSRTYGVEVDTGRVRYECTMNEGCKHFHKEETMDDILVIQREIQTVRAVEPRSGQEKWNFSVSQHSLDLKLGLEDLCSDDGSVQDYDDEFYDDSEGGEVFKAVVADGIICSVDRQSPEVINWSQKFDTPIVHAWRMVNGKLVKVDLFSTSALPEKMPVGEPLQEPATSVHTPLLYIGTYNHQLYIQESARLERSRETHDRLEIDSSALSSPRFPKVTWKPYLITSDSRTPIYNHGKKDSLPLLTYDEENAQSTALAVFGGSDYPFDSGLYLFPDEPDLAYDPVLDYDYHEDGDDDKEEDTIEVVFVSLWYWWKEVVLISIVTAFMMNWIITRPLIWDMRENFRQRVEQLSKKKPDVVVVEVPVQVPVQSQQSITHSSNSKASQQQSPSTDGSAKEFSWSRSNSDGSGEFVSRYLADFEPVQCLGKGGFGVVFESKNKIDDNHYAVKRIRLPKIEAAKKKVMREVKCLAKLDHKNIVRYFNTWLERPPPGWQETQDRWWKEQRDKGLSTNLSASFLSSSEFNTEEQNSSIQSDLFQAKLPVDPAGGDSFSICFEKSKEESSVHFEISSQDEVQEEESLSNCADALQWEEREQKRKEEKEHVYLYIVMQLCQKESLKDWLKSNDCSTMRLRSLHLFRQICLGVEYVHSQGLIHRDLKPSNIFFSTEGTVKIGDFGLVTDQNDDSSFLDDPDASISSSQESQLQQHTDQVGTELYMSPEQLARQPYDHKVDIYSLGLVLFELLVPFSTQMERVRTLSDLRKMMFPRDFESNCSEYDLVKSMLHHDPEERPEAADLLEMEFLRPLEETPKPRRQASMTRKRTYTSSSGFSNNEED